MKEPCPLNLSTVADFEIGSKERDKPLFNARISNTLLPVFAKDASPDDHNLKTGM